MTEITLKKNTVPIVTREKSDILTDLESIKNDVLESFADSIALTTKDLSKNLDLSDNFDRKNLKDANSKINWNEYKNNINNDIFSYCSIVIDKTLNYEGYEEYHSSVEGQIENWLRRNARAEAIDITDKSKKSFRKNYRNYFSESDENVPSPLIIKKSLGLPPKYTRAVNNLLLNLRENQSFRKARDRAKDYITDLRQRRGELIANTELWDTIMKTRVILHDHLFTVGVLDKRRIGKQWVTGKGDCDQCLRLNGETRQWNETFEGKLKFPPAHPQDSCGYRLVKI